MDNWYMKIIILLRNLTDNNKKKAKDRTAATEIAAQRKEHQKRLQELKKEVQELNKALNKKKNRGGGSAPTGDYAMGVTDAPKAVNSKVRMWEPSTSASVMMIVLP